MTKTFLTCRKTLLVQFNSKESGQQTNKYQVLVSLKKVQRLHGFHFPALLSCFTKWNEDIVAPPAPQGCSDVSGFIQAVLGLLLPLGYEYDPNLVLLVRMPGSELRDSLWQQLTGLLQGLAQGHTLILMPVRREEQVLNHTIQLQRKLREISHFRRRYSLILCSDWSVYRGDSWRGSRGFKCWVMLSISGRGGVTCCPHSVLPPWGRCPLSGAAPGSSTRGCGGATETATSTAGGLEAAADDRWTLPLTWHPQSLKLRVPC